MAVMTRVILFIYQYAMIKQQCLCYLIAKGQRPASYVAIEHIRNYIRASIGEINLYECPGVAMAHIMASSTSFTSTNVVDDGTCSTFVAGAVGSHGSTLNSTIIVALSTSS